MFKTICNKCILFILIYIVVKYDLLTILINNFGTIIKIVHHTSKLFYELFLNFFF